MNILKSSLGILSLCLALSGQAQDKTIQNSSAIVNGNCGMCKKTIEKAAIAAKASNANWDADSKQITFQYDPTKTSEEAILKKIAQAGYDNQGFRAPDDVYAKLHECCLYDRDHETASKGTAHHPQRQVTEGHSQHTASGHNSESKPLDASFEAYIQVKNALIASDAKAAATHAKALQQQLEKVEMAKLGENEHQVWMQVYKGLIKDAKALATSKDLEKQRQSFTALSKQFITLAQSAQIQQPLYVLHCPMANGNTGADWLSKEEAIKNPYFGSKMMNCGELKEKIQN